MIDLLRQIVCGFNYRGRQKADHFLERGGGADRQRRELLQAGE